MHTFLDALLRQFLVLLNCEFVDAVNKGSCGFVLFTCEVTSEDGNEIQNRDE